MEASIILPVCQFHLDVTFRVRRTEQQCITSGWTWSRQEHLHLHSESCSGTNEAQTSICMSPEVNWVCWKVLVTGFRKARSVLDAVGQVECWACFLSLFYFFFLFTQVWVGDETWSQIIKIQIFLSVICWWDTGTGGQSASDITNTTVCNVWANTHTPSLITHAHTLFEVWQYRESAGKLLPELFAAAHGLLVWPEQLIFKFSLMTRSFRQMWALRRPSRTTLFDMMQRGLGSVAVLRTLRPWEPVSVQLGWEPL